MNAEYMSGEGTFGYWREISGGYEVWGSSTVATLPAGSGFKSCALEPIEACDCIE